MFCLTPDSGIRHYVLSQVFGLGKENGEKQDRLMD